MEETKGGFVLTKIFYVFLFVCHMMTYVGNSMRLIIFSDHSSPVHLVLLQLALVPDIYSVKTTVKKLISCKTSKIQQQDWI